MVENIKKTYWSESLTAFARMSGWIVGPILIAVFLGKWLDRIFDTTPIIFFVTVGISFVLSTVAMLREAKKYMNGIEKDIQAKKQDDRTHTTDN